MKSFLEYLKQRSIIAVDEMAQSPRIDVDEEGNEKTINEVRKVPIFADDEDIKFLNQLPPNFWAHGLYQRYNILLEKAYQARKNNQTFDDSRIRIKVKDRNNKQSLEFEIKDAGINRLLDKLTRDVDEDQYVVFKSKDDYENYAKEQEKVGKMYGHYSFSIDDWKRKGASSVTVGYVPPGLREAREWVDRWLKGLEEGWFDEEIAEKYGAVSLEKISSRSTKLPAVKKTWVTTSGRPYPPDGRGFLPTLVPARMFKTKDVQSFNIHKKTIEEITKDLSTEENLKDYINLIDLQTGSVKRDSLVSLIKKMQSLETEAEKLHSRSSKRESIERELVKLRKLGLAAELLVQDLDLGLRGVERRTPRSVDSSYFKKQYTKKLMEINPEQINIVPSKLAIKFKKSLRNSVLRTFVVNYLASNPEASNEEVVKSIKEVDVSPKFVENVRKFLLSNNINPKEFDEEKSVMRTVNSFLTRLLRTAESILPRIQKRAREQSLDLFAWNKKRFKERLPHTEYTGFGVYNPNKQNREQTYTSLRQIFQDDELINRFYSDLIKNPKVNEAFLEGVNLKLESLRKMSDGLKATDIGMSVIMEAIYSAFVTHKNDLVSLSKDYFRRKSSVSDITAYARIYKLKMDEKEVNSKTERAAFVKVLNRARKDASTQVNLMYQIHKRLRSRSRYNRNTEVRPEVPGDISLGEYFRDFYAKNLASISSHSIDQLYASMAGSESVAKLIASIGLDSNSQIDSKEAEVSKSIIKTTTQIIENYVKTGKVTLEQLAKKTVSKILSIFQRKGKEKPETIQKSKSVFGKLFGS